MNNAYNIAKSGYVRKCKTMKTNIFVPKKINVGFQNRNDTYTGKLAYVIYYDQKGKLRKEVSWSEWRDNSIPNEVYDNEPMEGFVLNKKVGGVEDSYGSWDVRKTYTRIYDPRGFEFEITVPNLLWILENCDCTRGKGLEGKFVYGWDGTELVLVPIDSPDYKEIEEKSNVIHNNEFIKAKDLIIGATYETLKGERYVYMGKYDHYNLDYNRHHTYGSWNFKDSGWDCPLDETWIDDTVNGNEYTRYKTINLGKKFWFIYLATNSSWRHDEPMAFSNVTRKFAKLITTECDKYTEYYELMTNCSSFSPIDYTRNKLYQTSYATFHNEISTRMVRGDYHIPVFHLDPTGTRLTVTNIYRDWQTASYYYETTNRYNYGYTKHWVKTIDDIYNTFNPMYGEQYLENGNLYLRRGYYAEE